jgi:putative transposase
MFLNHYTEFSMKKSRFLDTQIITILKQAESGTPIPKLCGEHNISNATFYVWRKKFREKDVSTAPPAQQVSASNPEPKKGAAARPKVVPMEPVSQS